MSFMDCGICNNHEFNMNVGSYYFNIPQINMEY